MIPSLDASDFAEYSAAERILLAQDLWDSVIGVAEPSALLPSELQWLRHRVDYADRLDAEWFVWDDILAGIKARRVVR